MHRVSHSLLQRPRRLLRGARRTLLWQRAAEIELMHRALGFAALGFVTLAPLLIVIAAVSPFQSAGFGGWVVTGLGVSGKSADAVERLFTSPNQVLSTTTAFSLAALAVFGLTFGQSMQVTMEKIWGMRPARWHTHWRHAVWLAALMAYVFFEAQISILLEGSPLGPGDSITVACVTGVLFFWWSQRMLLVGRISWRALLPGAILTVIGLVGLRIFSQLVFAPLIVSNAVTYGAIGTLVMVQSWLIGVGFVVYGAAIVGRILHDRHEAAHGRTGEGGECDGYGSLRPDGTDRRLLRH